MKHIILTLIAILLTACFTDITEPQAGYFDERTDKSNNQTFNNNGDGTMEVNINYNHQNSSPTVVNTVVPANASQPSYAGYRIGVMQIEYIKGTIYGTNYHSKRISWCDIAYRTDTPNTAYLSDISPNMSDSYSIYSKPSCITLTALNCRDSEHDTVTNWTGSQTICMTE